MRSSAGAISLPDRLPHTVNDPWYTHAKAVKCPWRYAKYEGSDGKADCFKPVTAATLGDKNGGDTREVVIYLERQPAEDATLLATQVFNLSDASLLGTRLADLLRIGRTWRRDDA